MSETYKLYAHPIGQPSRALIWLCAIAKIPLELEVVMPFSLGKDGQLIHDTQFLDKFPAGTIPSLEITEADGKTKHFISDATAVALYFAEKGLLNEFGGGSAIVKAKATQIAVLSQTAPLRMCSGKMFFPYMMAMMTQKDKADLNIDQIKHFHSEELEGALVDLSRIAGWCVAKHDGTTDELVENPKSVFLVAENNGKPTFADFLVYAELHQLEILGQIEHTGLLVKRPAVRRFLDAMKALPGYDDANKALIEVSETLRPLGPAELHKK